MLSQFLVTILAKFQAISAPEQIQIKSPGFPGSGGNPAKKCSYIVGEILKISSPNMASTTFFHFYLYIVFVSHGKWITQKLEQILLHKKLLKYTETMS